MKFERDKLTTLIREKFGTQKAFAEALGVEESTLSRYLSDGRDWKGQTLIKAVRLLEIPEAEIDSYFFTLRVVKKQPRKKAKT